MGAHIEKTFFESMSKPKKWYLPIKILVTMIVIMISLGMSFALGQIVIHDIIPTFAKGMDHVEAHSEKDGGQNENRGDLFASDMPKKSEPFFKSDEFIFALKFTHIHVFGMGAIFILMGAIVVFLDLHIKLKAWLIILPFVGIIVDLASVWLKFFIHPVFFWLHIPGGALFGVVFSIVVLLSVWQMWVKTE